MLNLGWLAKTGSCRKYIAGKSITGAGVSGLASKAVYILISGKVDVYDANTEIGMPPAYVVLPGDTFGGREFFTGEAEYVYKAADDSVVYIVTEDSFGSVARRSPEILYDILKAAYTPLRKASDLSETRQNEGGTTGTAGETEVSGASGASGASGLSGTETVQAASKDIETVEAMIASIPISGDFFPENHKLYPGVTKSEYLKLVYEKDYDCPFCGSNFSGYRISNSKLFESTPARYDLRRFYTGFQTEWYEIVTCPHCLFSMFQVYFTEPKPLRKDKIENLLIKARESVILQFDTERDIDFVFTAHYLALLCAEGYSSNYRQIRARLWGNLSWLYEDVENEEMMKYSAEMAAEAYEAVYKETVLTPVQEQVTCLSIAGMQYRAGIDRDMKRYLFAAKTSKSGNKVYNTLADDFMETLSAQEAPEEPEPQEEPKKNRKKKID